MFKKAASVAFKGETRLKGKDAKRLREAVAARLGGEPSATALLPPKADVVARKVGGGSSAQFVFADGECLLVQIDGKAELGEAEMMPTLMAFWRIGEATALLPCVLIQPPVAKFVFGGANVMAPGIHSVLPRAGSSAELPREGDLVAVRALGNPAACAVGVLRMPAESLGGPGSRGEAVEVLHYFGDSLWEACGSKRPPGFVGDQILATAPEAWNTEASAAVADAPGSAGSAEATPASSPQGADAAEPAQAVPEVTPADMSRALEECLLQALKTRIKEKDLPMLGNTLYSQHMRPCRRAGSHIDVKASSFKKLAAFLEHAEGLGWIALKKHSAEPTLTRVVRDHPDLREWRPWPRSATAEAAELGEAEGEGGAAAAPSASIKVDPVWPVAKLAPLLEALATEGVAPADGHWTQADCAEALRRYADLRSLWMRNNRKRIEPDELLLGLLGDRPPEDDSAAPQGYSTEGLADRLLGKLPSCHRVVAPQKGAVGGTKCTVRPGKPPTVKVRTDKRRGHNVTLVQGIEAYGVDGEAFAAFLQKTLAASSAVEEATPQSEAGIMVQGFWDVAVVDILRKAGIPEDSIQHQAKKGQHQAKTKQATNIVRG